MDVRSGVRARGVAGSDCGGFVTVTVAEADLAVPE